MGPWSILPVLVSSAPLGQTDIAVLGEDEVGTAERAIGACRLVPYRYVRCDVAIHQPFEQPGRAIDRVAREPLRPQIKTALNTVHHGLGDGNLYCSVCSSAYGIDDDANLVVDQIVCIVGKEGRPGLETHRSEEH